jgi:outer membrane protein
MSNKYQEIISILKNTLRLGVVASALVIGAQAQVPDPATTPIPVNTPLPATTPTPIGAPNVSPNYVAPTRPLPPAERVGVNVSQQKPLSLNEVITMALENSNDIEASQIDVKLAEFSLSAARGVFDPRLSGQTYFQRSTVPTANTLGSVDGSLTSSGVVGNVGVTGFTPIGGGSYTSSFQQSRETTNNPLNALNPQFPSALTFSYTQPLWRNFKTDDNRRRIAIAKKNLSLSDSQFRQRSIDIITNAVQAYWDLTYALRNLQVQNDAVKQAKQQVESNQRQVAEGVIAPIEVVEAETQVTNFEQQVYAAQQSVTQAENVLKTIILTDSNADLWTQAIVPTTPVNVDPPKVSVEDALAEARANRPELEQLRVNKEVNEINTRFYKNQTKPQIDLVGSFTSNGLAGTALANNGGFTSFLGPLYDRINLLSASQGLPPLVVDSTGNTIPGSLIGGAGQSLRGLFGFQYPTYQVGVKIDLPFFNRTAKANLGYSLAEGTQIDARTAQQDQVIKSEVQNALQAIRTAEARMNAAAASRAASEKLYASEQNKLQNGASTLFVVLERQQNLITARGIELQTQTDLNKAIAAFQKAVGTTFQAHNVDVDSSSSTSQRLKITTPAAADTDSAGWLKENPRITPPITRSGEANSFLNRK